MVFTKRLREGVRRGEITCSVRFWLRPHVRVGARYPMGEGAIKIDSIEPIGFSDITPEMCAAKKDPEMSTTAPLKITRDAAPGGRDVESNAQRDSSPAQADIHCANG